MAGRRIEVPDTFDDGALAAARALAEGGDRLLGVVLGGGHQGRVAQHLAGRRHCSSTTKGPPQEPGHCWTRPRMLTDSE